MKKGFNGLIISILSGAILILFGLAGFADSQAPSLAKSKGLGLDAGYSLPSDKQLGGEPFLGLNLFYSFSNHFRIELRGIFIPIKTEADPEGLSAGNLNVIPIQLSLQYRFKINPRIYLYTSAGAGYYFTHFSIKNSDTWQNLGFEISEQTDNAWGFHGGIGIDYTISPHLIFNIDSRYCIANLSGNFTITEEVSGISHTGNIDGNLNQLLVGAGIQFLF